MDILLAPFRFLNDAGATVMMPIILTIFGFNLFGDGLRDAMDPKLKK